MKPIKTDTGQLAFKQRSPLLSTRQRAVFLMFDGSKTIADVLAATTQLGVTANDVEYLLAQGFLAIAASVVPTVPVPLEPGDDEDPADFPRWTLF